MIRLAAETAVFGSDSSMRQVTQASLEAGTLIRAIREDVASANVVTFFEAYLRGNWYPQVAFSRIVVEYISRDT